jgi:hypothetical protein
MAEGRRGGRRCLNINAILNNRKSYRILSKIPLRSSNCLSNGLAELFDPELTTEGLTAEGLVAGLLNMLTQEKVYSLSPLLPLIAGLKSDGFLFITG